MSITGLWRRLLGARETPQDNDFHLPRLGESRPRGHFREFTVPRRLQRGGVSLPAQRAHAKGCAGGIIPCTGGNIP